MAWRSAGSLTRSLSRISSLRSPPPMPRLRPPQSSPRIQFRRVSSTPSRNVATLGCTASFLPLQSFAAAQLHLTVNARAFSELSHGIEIGIDRKEWKGWVIARGLPIN